MDRGEWDPALPPRAPAQRRGGEVAPLVDEALEETDGEEGDAA